MMSELSLTDVEKFLDIFKKRGADVLSELGRITPCIHAVFGTEIGREILKEDIAELQILFTKVFNEQATEEEKAEFRVLKRRISTLSKRLENYLAGVGLIKKVAAQPNT
jgi:hypothetical protein